MAFVLSDMTVLTQGNSETDGTGFTTASITPTANTMVYVAVFSLGVSIGTVSLVGNGITWTQEETQLGGTVRRIALFRGFHATPSTGTIAITWTTTVNGCCWAVFELANNDTTTPVVQSVPGSGNNVTTLSITLAAFGDANNATLGLFGINKNEAITPGADFTEIAEQVQSTEATALQVEWKVGNDTSVDASWATNTNDPVGIACELKYLAAGVTTRRYSLPLSGVG